MSNIKSSYPFQGIQKTMPRYPKGVGDSLSTTEHDNLEFLSVVAPFQHWYEKIWIFAEVSFSKKTNKKNNSEFIVMTASSQFQVKTNFKK